MQLDCPPTLTVLFEDQLPLREILIVLSSSPVLSSLLVTKPITE